MFNFFKVGFSGKLGKSTDQNASVTSETELTHTYGSLLHRLGRYLMGEGLITTVAGGDAVAANVGDFIEFSGTARPNPFTDSFHRLERMLQFVPDALAMERGSVLN